MTRGICKPERFIHASKIQFKSHKIKYLKQLLEIQIKGWTIQHNIDKHKVVMNIYDHDW